MTEHRDREEELPCAAQVAAGEIGAGGGGERGHAVEQLEAFLLAEVSGEAEGYVGLAGLGAHCRQVGEGGGEGLVANLSWGGEVATEMHAVNQGVDRGRRCPAGHRDRRVVAAAEMRTWP